MDTLADRLKAARAEASLTQQQLADLCRVSQSTIAGIERGRNTRGSLMLPRIAAVLRVNVLWLAEGRGTKRQPGNGAGPLMLGYLQAKDDEPSGKALNEMTSNGYRVMRTRNQAIIEVMDLMNATDDLGRQLILGAARGAIANHRAATTNNQAS